MIVGRDGSLGIVIIRLDVFLVGVLVAVVKLLDLASVLPGIALVAFVALMLLAVASSATLDREAVWQRIRRDAL